MVSPYLKSISQMTPDKVVNDDKRINDIMGSATSPDVLEASQNMASQMMTNALMLHDNGEVLSSAEKEMFSSVISNNWGIDKDLVKADLPGFIERYTGIKVGNNWLQELGEYASTWDDNKKLSFYQFKMNFLDPESDAYKKYQELSDNISMNIQKKQKTFKNFGKFGTSIIEAAPTTMQLLEQLAIMTASMGAGALAGGAAGAGALVNGGTLGGGVGAMLAGSTGAATMAGAATGTMVGQQLNLLHMDIIEAGGKAHEMRQMYNEDGSPMFTNQQIALASTVYAAGIHLIEGYTDKFVDPIVKGMGINKLSEPLKNLFNKNFATRLLGYAWDTIGQSAQEGIEGLWSSVVTDTTKDLIDILHRNNVNFDEERVKKEFSDAGKSAWEDFSQSIVGFGVGGIPSALLANMAGLNRAYYNPTAVTNQMRTDANTYFDGGQPIDIYALDTQGESWSKETEESMKEHKHHAVPVIMSESGLYTPINASDRAYIATLRESGATGASVIFVNRDSGNVSTAQYYASVIDEMLTDTDVEMDDDYTPDTSVNENDESEIDTSENGIIYGTSGNIILVNGKENISKVEQFFKDNERTSAIIHNEDGSVSIAVKENGRNTMLKIKALEESDTVKPEKVTPVQSYREWATLETERRVESDPFNTSNYLRNYEEKMAFDEIDKALPENDKMTFEEKRALQFSKLGAARIMPIVSEVTGINTSDLLKKFTFTFDTGRLGDMAYGGMEESNGQYKITINKKVRPDTIMHEILHGLRRLATKEQLSGFASAYGGTEGAMWASDIEKTDGGYRLGDKVYKTYSEAFEAVRANEERFVDDFMRYLYGEEGFTDSQKSFFAQVKEFFENFWDRMRELLAPKLSAETVRAFDILFGKDTPVQERADFIEVAATEGIRTAVELANTGLEDAIERDEENGLDEEGNTLWQKVTDQNLVNQFESEPKIKAYRAMQILDGELYSPMATVVGGSRVNPVEIGQWYKADERPDLLFVKEKGTGKYVPASQMTEGVEYSKDSKTKEVAYYFYLDKDKNPETGKKQTSLYARYNPYWHSSLSPLNDQFTSASTRPNLVTVEVEIPVSDINSGYMAQFAKDSVGETTWKSGPVSEQLAKEGNPRKVFLSQFNKVVRVLSESEVAQAIKDQLGDTGISIPVNTVTPQLRAELEKINVPMLYQGYDWDKGMSNNAVAAYESGEKPLSKWSKADILSALKKETSEEVADILGELPINVLRDAVLERTSWHHTSKYYNKTNFYSLKYLEGTTPEEAREFVDLYKWHKEDLKRAEREIEEIKKAEIVHTKDGDFKTSEGEFKASLIASTLFFVTKNEKGGKEYHEIPFNGAKYFSAQEFGVSGKILWQRAGDINSEQFINWFKGSKVVNSDGSPMVVYHGTNELFEDFEHGKASNTYANSAKNGFFFTSNRRVADSYLLSRRLERIESGEIVDIPTNPRVMEVYLHMENPLEYDTKSGERKTWDELFDEAKKDGHDGIIVRNIIDAKTGASTERERQYYGEADDYVVFSNDQIRIKDSGLSESNALYQRIMDRNTQARDVLGYRIKKETDGSISSETRRLNEETRSRSRQLNDSIFDEIINSGKEKRLIESPFIRETGTKSSFIYNYNANTSNVKIEPFHQKDSSILHQRMMDRNTQARIDADYEKVENTLKADASNFDSDGNHLAPNGKKSNLTYRQWVQVRTPAFKAWFGDWENDPQNASNVVDENGEPLVMYHGSRNTDIEIFNDNYSSVNGGVKGLIYATPDIVMGNTYAHEGRVYELFMNMRNPLDFKNLDSNFYDTYRQWYIDYFTNKTKEAIAGFYEPESDDEIKSRAEKMAQAHVDEIKRKVENNFSPHWEIENDFYNHLSEYGYDGYIDKFLNEYAVTAPNQIKSATDNSGEFSTENDSILYQQNHTYDSRSYIPKVRNGWTKEKIIRYLKSNPTPSGLSLAINLIKEFDSWQELKDHMFYHGSQFGSKNLKPSITMSDREIERVGGGGYGEKYWAISLSKNKKIASNFSGTGYSVNIYPVILAKNAKVIELENVHDSADLDDIIVDLYTQGVDAVWIGGGEEELAVINPKAIVNLGTPHLGWDDNPLNIKNDEQIQQMYEYAKQYTPKYAERDFGKPKKPSRYVSYESLERKAPEVYERELAEYNEALNEWYQSNNYKKYNDFTEEREQTILFQLSDEEKKKALESRKRDIETATAGGYWVRTEYIEEFAGEDWADRELKVRHWMQEKPDDYKELKDIARRVGDYQEFKEELHKKYEDNWFDEDESFYKRIYQLAQTRTAQEKDSEFIARNVMGDDNLLRTAKALKGYADLDFVPKPGRRSGGYYKIIGQLNRAKGVSNKVRSLSDGERGKERSTSEEIQAARELILKNPRAYRMAYEKAMLGEDRAGIIRGVEGKRFETEAVRQESNDLIMNYDLDTLDDRLEAELYSMQEEQLQAEKKANLAKAKKTDWKKTAAQLEKKLAQANADLEKLNTEKLSRQQAQKQRDEAIAERNELRKQMTELQNQLSETKAERSQFKAQRNERRKRVEELRKQLVEAKRKVRTLTRILDAYQRKAEAINAKNARIKLIKTIKDTVPIGKKSFGAGGTYDVKYLEAFSFIQGLFGKQDRSELLERRSELISLIKNYQEQGVESEEYAALRDELDTVRALINASEMRTVPAMLQPYTMALHLNKGENGVPAYMNSLQMKADSRQSMWTLDELSDILNVAQKVAFDARSLKIQRDENVRTRRKNVVDGFFAQTYEDFDAQMETEDLEDLIVKTPTLKYGGLLTALYGYKIANGMIGRMSRMFDGNKEGVLYDFFTRQARKLAESELGQISKRLEAGENKFKELGLKTSDLNKQFFFDEQGRKEKYTIFHSGSGENMVLTKGDMIGVYVYMQNEDGAEKIQSAFGNGISPEDAKRIVNALTEQEKAWGDYLIEDMSSQWARIDNVYYEVFNMNLGKVQRYFPLISQNKLSKEMEDSIIMVGPDGDAVRWVNKSMTKERVHHAIYPLQLNVSRSWTSNIRKQEHFIAFAEWSRDANYYLGNHGYIGEIITKKFSKEAEDSLQDFVNSINSPKMYQDEDDKRLASIVGRGASAAIVGNISVMLKQIPTMASAIGNVGLKEFFGSAIAPNVTLENFLKANNIMFEYGDKAIDFIGENSPIMRNRRFGMELVGETGGIGKSNIDNLSAKISDKLMKATAGFTDKYVVSTLWLARYMTVFNELKAKADKNHKVFDINKAHEEAVFKAGQLISETQNTSVPMDMSQRMRKAKANPYMKPFYLFSSVGMNVFNMIAYDIPYSFRNKDIKGIAKTVSFVLINVLATMAINGSIVKKDNEDDEEYQKRIRNQLIGQAVGLGIPGWGSMLSNAISGNTYGSSADIALISDASTVLRKAFNPSDNKTAWETFISLLESLGYVSMEGIGLPANLTRKTYNAFKNGNPFYLVNSTWGDLMGDK